MKRSKQVRYLSVLTVYVPSSQALIDMMRYERCCPFEELDSSRITSWASGSDKDRASYNHIVHLLRFAHDANQELSPRWQSFNCRVLDEQPLDSFVPLSHTDIARLMDPKIAALDAAYGRITDPKTVTRHRTPRKGTT